MRLTGKAGRVVRAGWFAVGVVLAVAGSSGATLEETEGTDARSYTRSRLGADEFLSDEVFHSHLPTTLEKNRLRLSVNPRLGDWERKDHMRLTTRLRYGLTDTCEISASSNLYFSHGNGAVPAFENHGAANLRLGAKFDLGQPLFPGWETAAGAEYEFPTGRPPVELTDGLRHFRPYVTFSRRLESRPSVRLFVGFRCDVVRRTSVPGEIGDNAFHESSTGITGGWVLDRDRWHYTFEASYDTNRLIGHGSEDIFSIRPGVLWEIPPRGDTQVRSNWMVGVSVNSTFGPGGCSVGASFKLRYSSDLKNRFRRYQSLL